MRSLCLKYGVKVPSPIYDSRSYAFYKVEICDAEVMYMLGREMILAGRKPKAFISRFNDSTIVMQERRGKEKWTFKHYTSNSVQAENLLSELLDVLQPSRQYQETLDL